MKRRIGIKRRLMAQRLINRRRSVLKNADAIQRDQIADGSHVDTAFVVSTRLPLMLSDSLAA